MPGFGEGGRQGWFPEDQILRWAGSYGTRFARKLVLQGSSGPSLPRPSAGACAPVSAQHRTYGCPRCPRNLWVPKLEPAGCIRARRTRSVARVRRHALGGMTRSATACAKPLADRPGKHGMRKAVAMVSNLVGYKPSTLSQLHGTVRPVTHSYSRTFVQVRSWLSYL